MFVCRGERLHLVKVGEYFKDICIQITELLIRKHKNFLIFTHAELPQVSSEEEQSQLNNNYLFTV